MKQYLDPQQTAKLIGLGFERPKSYTNEASFLNCGYTYSIGELIELLPMIIGKDYGYTLSIYMDGARWIVAYDNGDEYSTLYAITKAELIDALYDMIVKLKEEGVI